MRTFRRAERVRQGSRTHAVADLAGSTPTIRLGTVESRHGELALVDFGCLRFWSGDAAPVVPDGVLDPVLTEKINGSLDLEIVGPDADEAAALLDLAAVSGKHAFDVPAGSTVVQERLAAVCAQHRLDAWLRPVPRMPHRERLRTRLERTPTGAEVPFHGLGAVAVRGVPARTPLPVLGERMDDGEFAGLWRSVWVEVAPGEVAASYEIGVVLVDEARLMFADPDALAEWRVDRSVDGLVDLVFWGRDAVAVAAGVGSGTAEESGATVHGWWDLDLREVEIKQDLLRRARDERGARIAVDVRPHDDNHRVLATMRRSDTGSATDHVGGSAVCGLFTTWGDGAFPVYRDVSADGDLLRLRVELGAPEIVARARRLHELWFGELSKKAIAAPGVVAGEPVGRLEREAPLQDDDSGWCVYTGAETQDELDQPGPATLVPLRDLVAQQPELEPLLTTPPPAAFERAEDGRWRSIPPPPAPD